MDVIFNIEEIFDIAINIEKNGVKFYKLAADNFNDSKLKEKFLELADMESDHIKSFSELKKQVCGNSQYLNDTFDEVKLYLNEFTSGNVFDLNANFDTFFTDTISVEEILKKAIGLEKDSIIFYLGLEKMVPENLGKDKVREILDQEMDHIRQLSCQITTGDF